jgi:hypothetical protein
MLNFGIRLNFHKIYSFFNRIFQNDIQSNGPYDRMRGPHGKMGLPGSLSGRFPSPGEFFS